MAATSRRGADSSTGKHSAGGATPATRALAAAGIAFTEHPYEHDPAHPSFGLEAAEALGVDPAAVFKTLCTDVGGRLVVAVIPVQARLDLKSLARAVGAKKASLANPAVAERVTGYIVGGISPIGQKADLETVIDESAILLEQMYVSGGRRGFDVGLAPDDLVSITGGQFAAIATG